MMDTLATDKKISLSFESLKPGSDFSSLTMKVVGGILFQYKAVSSKKKKICCIVWPHLLVILAWFSG